MDQLTSEIRFLDMMTQCFPDNLALITSCFELAFSFCMIVGSELGGYLYEQYGFWAPLNISSEDSHFQTENMVTH